MMRYFRFAFYLILASASFLANAGSYEDYFRAVKVDDARTVGELVKELSGKTGEKVAVRRFVRFQLGEDV